MAHALCLEHWAKRRHANLGLGHSRGGGADVGPKSKGCDVNRRQNWSPGDWAIYRKTKRSQSPGRRATKILASEKGESYIYLVDKFWVVESITPDDQLCLRTARGKTNRIPVNDPNLRRPNLLQRFLWRARFRKVEESLRQPMFAA